MYGKILSLLLKPVTTNDGKSSISAVWQGFEFTFVLIIIAKLFPIFIYKFDWHIPKYISIVRGQIHLTFAMFA